jgi:uncharacterized membrane protein
MSDWYYADNNEQRGPVLESDLKGLLASKKLSGETLVWKEGMANWTAAAQVAALSSPAAAAPVVASVAGTSNPSSVTPITKSDLIGAPEALEVDPDDAEKNKIFGIIAYLGFLCFVPLIVAKDSPFAKYHANQGFTLFLAEVAFWVVEWIITLVSYFVLPSSGYGIIGIVFDIVALGFFALAVLGIINAAKGKCLPLPVIGGVKLLK